MSKLISIVVPCFNEEESLPIFYTEICKIREKMKQKYEADFEIDSIDIEILPRPDTKLDLEKNKIVEYIGEDYNKFVETYNL